MDIKTAKKIISNIRFGQTRNASRIKKGQGLREQPIQITAEDILKKFKDQNGKCYWSGIELNEEYNYIKRHPLAISIDRLDNQIGYEYDNVALTLRVFNLGRGSYNGEFQPIMKFLNEKLNLSSNLPSSM